MAIKQTALCDRCGELIVGDGYSAAFYVGSHGATIKVKAEIALHEVGNKHFCGKTCLVKEIGDTIDGLPNTRQKEEKRYGIVGRNRKTDQGLCRRT